ncbi:hypothetical protein [Amycolatopsis sp. CA-128772]|uniref:hypothetical protein n=1 Tax=Amycolatopsis sp. CA-128772 TaxID=2073159 RepID=UPI000CD123C8|nr:hypothetical protein [Amycolatopsis sp. CA-128772]
MGRIAGKRLRQLLVFVHVVVSVGWMGAGAANVVLAMTAGYTDRPDVRNVCYLMIDRVDEFVVIPAAFASLAGGLLLCVVTKWGVARYWWVLVKLVLTVAVIGYSTFGLGVWVEESMAAGARGVESPVAGPLAYGAALNLVAFLFMTWLSVAKPWGRTPWTAPAGRGSRPAPAYRGLAS